VFQFDRICFGLQVQQRDDSNGVRWTRCPAVSPAQASSQLIAKAGLQMLLYSLQRDPEATSQLVVRTNTMPRFPCVFAAHVCGVCCRQSISSALVSDLKPLSLYTATATATDATLSSVSNFVLSLAVQESLKSSEPSSASVEMMELILQLVSCRGSLHATLEVAQALLQTP
jgi:hypothetical protein